MQRISMKMNSSVKQLSFAAAGLALAGVSAQAQTLLQTNGQVIATNGGQVPNMPVGVIFGGTSTFDSGVLDESGNLIFRGRMQDPGMVLTPPLGNSNDRAYFRGTSAGDLAMVLRSGDLAPGFTMGERLTATVGTSLLTGLSGSPRLSPNGQLFFGAAVTGGSVTTGNDGLIYAGPLNGLSVLVRENVTSAPLGGATMSSTFGTGTSFQSVGMNRNGRFVFKTNLAGGDVVGTTNNDAVITGLLGGAYEWVIRKGDMLPGGQIVSATGGFLQQINDAGQIVHDVTLSTTLGTNPAMASNDRLLFIYTPGMGNTPVVREGDPAPGTVGATFNVTSNSWFINMPASGFNNSGEGLMIADLLGGDVVTGVNDRAVYIVSTSGLTLAQRKGDPAPGTDALFQTVNNSNTGLNNSGRFFFASTITGGTVTTANDAGIWTGTPGNLQLVAREGQLLPGTATTEMAINVSLSAMVMNDLGQVFFPTDLRGPDVVPAVNDRAYCVWDPNLGLRVVARSGQQIEALPTVFRTISGWGGIQFNNCSGNPLSHNLNGVVTLRLNFDDGTAAIVKFDVPSLPGSPYCAGDGVGTPCPCGNNSPLGANEGCLNSFAQGAKLVASGVPSLSSDSLVLNGTQMPNAPGLFFQGTTQINGGLGTVFGDGLRCAGGSVVRLTQEVPVGGMSQYPDLGDQPLSVQGLVMAPGVRTYQIWYRNAAAFCTPDGWNLTNAWSLTWTP
jgi:hypothetical protein